MKSLEVWATYAANTTEVQKKPQPAAGNPPNHTTHISNTWKGPNTKSGKSFPTQKRVTSTKTKVRSIRKANNYDSEIAKNDTLSLKGVVVINKRIESNLNKKKRENPSGRGLVYQVK